MTIREFNIPANGRKVGLSGQIRIKSVSNYTFADRKTKKIRWMVKVQGESLNVRIDSPLFRHGAVHRMEDGKPLAFNVRLSNFKSHNILEGE